MSSSLDFVEYVTEQLSDAGFITYRKMFGEYALYCSGKIFALICDNQFFMKITEAGRQVCPDLEEAPPYEGAKLYFIVDDIDDRKLLTELTMQTCKELPTPKVKKRKI